MHHALRAKTEVLCTTPIAKPIRKSNLVLREVAVN